jgi:hypothetical protein
VVPQGADVYNASASIHHFPKWSACTAAAGIEYELARVRAERFPTLENAARLNRAKASYRFWCRGDEQDDFPPQREQQHQHFKSFGHPLFLCLSEINRHKQLTIQSDLDRAMRRNLIRTRNRHG